MLQRHVHLLPRHSRRGLYFLIGAPAGIVIFRRKVHGILQCQIRALGQSIRGQSLNGLVGAQVTLSREILNGVEFVPAIHFFRVQPFRGGGVRGTGGVVVARNRGGGITASPSSILRVRGIRGGEIGIPIRIGNHPAAEKRSVSHRPDGHSLLNSRPRAMIIAAIESQLVRIQIQRLQPPAHGHAHGPPALPVHQRRGLLHLDEFRQQPTRRPDRRHELGLVRAVQRIVQQRRQGRGGLDGQVLGPVLVAILAPGQSGQRRVQIGFVAFVLAILRGIVVGSSGR
mmetsp:Transcript_38212/g.80389  ORF Transcript_38212/g.80389 Transcript_38212/m.80389 type:complete len:284 (-) Transcript_38212:489-1340(-)